MCLMCDGASRDEVLFGFDALVARYGWALQLVEASAHEPPWVYTIGLSSGFDHPDLVWFGEPLEAGARVLNELGEQVRAGRHLHVGDHADVTFGRVLIGTVDERELAEGLVGMRDDYYDAIGHRPAPRNVLSVGRPEVTGGRRTVARAHVPRDAVARP